MPYFGVLYGKINAGYECLGLKESPQVLSYQPYDNLMDNCCLHMYVQRNKDLHPQLRNFFVKYHKERYTQVGSVDDSK